MSIIQRWRFLRVAGNWILGVTLLAPVLNLKSQPAESRPPAPRRPSIIFILADDLGYGDLGRYGQSRIKTPNLDRMADEGIRFTSFYAGSTVCAPSRAALMLGKHTGHLDIRGNGQGLALRAAEITVARMLKESGYHTGLIGKWGLGDEGSPGVPNQQGFDEFVGYLDQTAAHNYYPDHLWRYPVPGGSLGTIPLIKNNGGTQGEYTHDLFTTAALNFIRINKPDQFNKYRPFFLYLAYTIPHANNEAGRATGNGMQVPGDAPYSGESWPQVEKNKAAMITRLDAAIGRLLDKLKELKLEESTIVFFTSDNGPHKEGGVDPKFFNSSGSLRGTKRDLYEGGVRVPMIVRWPGKIKQGQISDFVWANWDFLPTAADIAQATAPKGIDGFSVLPLLLGRMQTNRHDFLYWEFHERGFQQAARMENWKAARPQVGEKLELYDLKTDPSEKQNVAEKNPAIVAKFEEYLKTARSESDRWPMKKPAEKAAGEKKSEPQAATARGK